MVLIVSRVVWVADCLWKVRLTSSRKDPGGAPGGKVLESRVSGNKRGKAMPLGGQSRPIGAGGGR